MCVRLRQPTATRLIVVFFFTLSATAHSAHSMDDGRSLIVIEKQTFRICAE